MKKGCFLQPIYNALVIMYLMEYYSIGSIEGMSAAGTCNVKVSEFTGATFSVWYGAAGNRTRDLQHSKCGNCITEMSWRICT